MWKEVLSEIVPVFLSASCWILLNCFDSIVTVS